MKTFLDVLQQATWRFLGKIDPGHPQRNIALVLQGRLEENIQKERAFGNSSDRTAERWEIIYQMNSLGEQIIGASFNSFYMGVNPAGITNTEDLHNLASIRHYIEALWEGTRNAYQLFNVGSDGDIWPTQCEKLIDDFHQCQKPDLPGEAQFVELVVRLAYIDEVVQNVTSLIGEFSASGRKTTRLSTKQRNDIRADLRLLPQKIENAIEFIASLDSITYDQPEKIVLVKEIDATTPNLPGFASLPDGCSAPDFSTGESHETHPRAS